METSSHKCPGCNANLPYDPKKGNWYCEYCGNSYATLELEAIENTIEEEICDYNEYECSNCGAKIITTETTTATFCVYCGSTSIMKNRLQGEFKPEEMILFKLDKEEAIAAYKKRAKQKRFIPHIFLKKSTIQKIRGVYLPVWLFDGDCDTQLYLHTKDFNETLDYIDIKKYSITEKVVTQFEKFPVDGLKSLKKEVINSIEPFDYTELKPFCVEYLSGFLAGKYDCQKDDVFQSARKRMEREAKNRAENVIEAYEEMDEIGYEITTEMRKAEYVLMPVWLLNVQYKKQNFLCAVNGQTGKCTCDFPISKFKVVSCFLVLFLAIFLTYIVIMHILNIYHIDIMSYAMPICLIGLLLISFLGMFCVKMRICWYERKLAKIKEERNRKEKTLKEVNILGIDLKNEKNVEVKKNKNPYNHYQFYLKYEKIKQKYKAFRNDFLIFCCALFLFFVNVVQKLETNSLSLRFIILWTFIIGWIVIMIQWKKKRRKAKREKTGEAGETDEEDTDF